MVVCVNYRNVLSVVPSNVLGLHLFWYSTETTLTRYNLLSFQFRYNHDETSNHRHGSKSFLFIKHYIIRHGEWKSNFLSHLALDLNIRGILDSWNMRRALHYRVLH